MGKYIFLIAISTYHHLRYLYRMHCKNIKEYLRRGPCRLGLLVVGHGFISTKSVKCKINFPIFKKIWPKK